MCLYHVRDACGWLHQLKICKLLQHKDRVVCPEGLNDELEALQFTFEELPLWDAATPCKPIHEPQLIEVDLGSVQPENVTTVLQTPTTTPVLPPSLANTMEPPGDIAMAINLELQGPWHSCSRLLSQPQPLSPSMACWGESCHWQPWRLCPQQKKQKIPSGQRGWTQPSVPQWQPPCRHLHGWPSQVTSQVSLMLLTHCSSPLCQKHWRGWACACSPQGCSNQTVG